MKCILLTCLVFGRFAGILTMTSSIVCGFGEMECGNQCYKTFEQKCHPGNIICPAPHKVCGTTCYDPFESKVCISDKHLCGILENVYDNTCSPIRKDESDDDDGYGGVYGEGDYY